MRVSTTVLSFILLAAFGACAVPAGPGSGQEASKAALEAAGYQPSDHTAFDVEVLQAVLDEARATGQTQVRFSSSILLDDGDVDAYLGGAQVSAEIRAALTGRALIIVHHPRVDARAARVLDASPEDSLTLGNPAPPGIF
jgi:hypothetical protein